MDCGNITWVDSSVHASIIGSDISCMEEGVAIQV